jgi:meso-butanediol dehydrogenase/(S,S)-butanediol dehydrogenase/diacetyl reductase
MQRFQDKVVLVTGAASGTAEATARRFSSEGARVALIEQPPQA